MTLFYQILDDHVLLFKPFDCGVYNRKFDSIILSGVDKKVKYTILSLILILLIPHNNYFILKI